MSAGIEPGLPESFAILYVEFIERIAGTALWVSPSYRRTYSPMDYEPEIVVKEGEKYEWVQFEN